jgi:hypothetical protein
MANNLPTEGKHFCGARRKHFNVLKIETQGRARLTKAKDGVLIAMV